MASKGIRISMGGFVALLGFLSSPESPYSFHLFPNEALLIGGYSIPIWLFFTLVGLTTMVVPAWDRQIEVGH